MQGNALAVPGKTLELAGLGARFNGDAFIASVCHTLTDGNWLTEVGFGLSPQGFVDTTQHIESAPAAGQLPAISGLHTGTVMKIDSDPQGQTRVQVKLALIDADMPVIDCLGDELLAAVQTGQTVRVLDGGVVEVA